MKRNACLILVWIMVGCGGETQQRPSKKSPGHEFSQKSPDKRTALAGIEPPKPFTNVIGMKFVWIPAGSFVMGSPAEEPERKPDEIPHKVTLTQGFYMGVHAVTQQQWQEIIGRNWSQFKHEDHAPVNSVNWHDCQEFTRKLRERDKLPYRLPTEAEWEYACRSGTTTPFHFGKTVSTEQANYHGGWVYATGVKGAYRKHPISVGTFAPNAFGLYDMHGNVCQWCQDWRGDYPKQDVIDPRGPDSGAERILRGGSYCDLPVNCRSACRNWSDPDHRSDGFGFRVCFSVDHE